mmetsp:Transcript_29005/g.39458  ORF Transcript_29005/g.39458 Transcript_29005/m.39458 type:complete len:250 (-) Transcript_29005:442-1191(-)
MKLIKGGYKRFAVKSSRGNFYRFLYVKQHQDKAEDDDSRGRTLYVANIFKAAREDAELELRNVFEGFGGIESVELNDQDSSNTGARSARIEFRDSSSIQEILTKDIHPMPSQLDDQEISRKLSLSKLMAAFGTEKPDQEKLQQDTDAAMTQFEEKEAAEATRRASLREGDADQDGFTEVVYKRKHREGAVNGTDDGKRRKKKQPLELSNFYRHQIREAKQEQLKKLRERFEEDKERIEKMKRIRKFRPT